MHKIYTSFHTKQILPTVKYVGHSLTVWGFFASSGAGQLALNDGNRNRINSVLLYQKKENVRPSLCVWKLKLAWVEQ